MNTVRTIKKIGAVLFAAVVTGGMQWAQAEGLSVSPIPPGAAAVLRVQFQRDWQAPWQHSAVAVYEVYQAVQWLLPAGLRHARWDVFVQKMAYSQNTLSPYDHLVRKYADKYQVDWTMIAAQMYQESRFNPDAVSHAGAVGLMQVMPATAKSMGFHDLRHPEASIHAGVRYMSWLRERFQSIPNGERRWFVLAAYNAGLGHIQDARRLAGSLGYDPNRWFGHVENALKLLSDPEFAEVAPNGWVRAQEPIDYVRSIRKRWQRFQAKVEQRKGKRELT